jgi:hypothetical protein
MSNRITVIEDADGLSLEMNGERERIFDINRVDNGQVLADWLESIGHEVEYVEEC